MNSVNENGKGFTLIELIVALAVFALCIAVAYPLFGLLSNMSNSEIDEFNQRNDVLLASQFISQDIHYAKSITCPETFVTEIIGEDGILVRYKLDNSNGNIHLVRDKAGAKQEFREITDVIFNLENSDLLSVKFITAISENDFKAARWGNSLALYNPVIDFLTGNKVTIFTDQLICNGISEIYGRDQTIYVNSGFSTSSNIVIESSLYFNGNVSINGISQLGFENKKNISVINGDLTLTGTQEINGDVYIAGNLSISGDATIHGNLYVQGNVTLSGIVKIKGTGSIEYEGTLIKSGIIDSSQIFKKPEVAAKEFPELTMPSLRSDEWYRSHGYGSGASLSNGAKVYCKGNYSADMSDNVNNAIIVSTGDITIEGLSSKKMMSGLLFAPNGKVTLNGQYFTGVIISKTTSFYPIGTYNARSIQDYIPNPEDYPFGGAQ